MQSNRLQLLSRAKERWLHRYFDGRVFSYSRWYSAHVHLLLFLVLQLEVARDYVKMYGEMGSKSNTMLFMEKPGDMSSLMAQAAAVMTETNKVISK